MAPSPTEQQHISEALQASQTAMDAIGTIIDVATLSLTIIGIFIGLLALFGVMAIVRQAKAQAKQIANKAVTDYIETDVFKALVNSGIDKSVQDRWRESVVANRLSEERRQPGDESAFPSGDQG